MDIIIRHQEKPPRRRVGATLGIKCFCGYSAQSMGRKAIEDGDEPQPRHLLCARHHAEWVRDFIRPKEEQEARATRESNALSRAREVVASRFELFANDPKVTQCARLPKSRPLRLPVRRWAIDVVMKREPLQLSAWFYNATCAYHLPPNLRALR